MFSLATQGCWGPKFLSSSPAVRSVLELLTCPPSPPATCTGGQGDQRVVKSKPECHGVCRKQPGPEQGPGVGGGLGCTFPHVPSRPRGSWWPRSWKPELGFGSTPSRCEAAPRPQHRPRWLGRPEEGTPLRAALALPTQGGPLKHGTRARFPGDGAVCPATVLKAPTSCGALGDPMCWVRQVSPTLPPLSLAGPAHPGHPHCMHAGL